MTNGCTGLEGYWTYADLVAVFSRSYMTIYLWKTHRGLPAVQISARRVLFPQQRVREWAEARGLVMEEGACI